MKLVQRERLKLQGVEELGFSLGSGPIHAGCVSAADANCSQG